VLFDSTSVFETLLKRIVKIENALERWLEGKSFNEGSYKKKDIPLVTDYPE